MFTSTTALGGAKRDRHCSPALHIKTCLYVIAATLRPGYMSLAAGTYVGKAAPIIQ